MLSFSASLGIPATCGIASTLLVAAGLARRNLTLQTGPATTGNLWINPTGGAAVVGQGICIGAGGGSFTFPNGLTDSVFGISDGGTININGIGA